MKKTIFIIFFLFPIFLYSQSEVSIGMGVNFENSSSLRDYVNFDIVGSDQLSTFNSSVEFFGDFMFPLNQNLQLGLEYALSIFSVNTSLGVSLYELSYNHHKPSVILYYVLKGEGYKLKFGGGVGYRYITLDEKIISTTSYTTSGFGLLLRAEAHTLLSNNLFALISGDFRADLPSEISKSDEKSIDLKSIAFGVKLGLSYNF